MTVEPGVYLEGLGGIRIEDDVRGERAMASADLTNAPRENFSSSNGQEDKIRAERAHQPARGVDLREVERLLDSWRSTDLEQFEYETRRRPRSC